MLYYLSKPFFQSRSQSYQTLISSFFRFLLLSLSVCSTRKYCLYIEMAKHKSKKWKKSSFYNEKSLVGLTKAENNHYLGFLSLQMVKTSNSEAGPLYIIAILINPVVGVFYIEILPQPQGLN
jgi:hypothetical protein